MQDPKKDSTCNLSSKKSQSKKYPFVFHSIVRQFRRHEVIMYSPALMSVQKPLLQLNIIMMIIISRRHSSNY